VGCGIGGTSRYLAKEYSCQVTGITISGQQVELARKLTLEDALAKEQNLGEESVSFSLGEGVVQFQELDAELMGEWFSRRQQQGSFDAVWISEAMSHLPNKELFFKNVELLLKPGGKLIVADWFKDEDLSEEQFKADIAPIEGMSLLTCLYNRRADNFKDGMLLPPLCTQSDYVRFASAAGLKTFSEPFDISKNVAKTW
jgi:tocopherol O-methyltransferase